MNRLMKGKVPSGVYCPVCDSEMIYVNHSCNVHPFGLVCNRVELHDKIVNGVNFRGEIVVHFVSVDELRLKFSNVFGLFLAGGEILPLRLGVLIGLTGAILSSVRLLLVCSVRVVRCVQRLLVVL